MVGFVLEMIKREGQDEATSRASGGVLHGVAWYRIVLDEAHCIKDRSCSTAQGVFKLSAEYRWGLSGTPLQVSSIQRE